MNERQWAFYRGLSNGEQYVLDMACLKAERIEVADLLRFASLKGLKNVQVRRLLESAVEQRLLYPSADMFGGAAHFEVDLLVMMHLYPLFGNYIKEFGAIRRQRFYFREGKVEQVGAFLFGLLFDDALLKETEKKWMESAGAVGFPDVSDLFWLEAYEKVFRRMSSDLFFVQLRYMFNRTVSEMGPLEAVGARINYVLSRVSFNDSYSVHKDRLLGFVAFQEGRFQKAAALLEGAGYHDALFVRAIESLSLGRMEEAFAWFSKGLKVQKQRFRGLSVPYSMGAAFFYLFTLACLPPETSAPAFNKYLKELDKKKELTVFDSALRLIALHALNVKDRFADGLASLFSLFEWQKPDNVMVYGLLVLYVVGKKPNKQQFLRSLEWVALARAGGYVTLAYEGAYALSQWSDNAEVQALLKALSVETGYDPILSRLRRMEEWEMSLNAFLALGVGKGSAKSAVPAEDKNRVVYWFDPSYKGIRPALLSRTAKGYWTKGRNIALKTFQEGQVEGMTEQDHRIAKHVKRRDSGWGYGVTWEISDTVFKELAGHPYIYLEGSDFIPVELVAAQPAIEVKKCTGGYKLSTSINQPERIVLKKETNTRFLVYDLNVDQRALITRVNEQKLLVPERGREKLLQVLNVFSSRMAVHSDVLSVDGEQAQTRTVTADTLLRVQLLPFGDGLKVELFAKPFGSLPPYCKPGKGGTTLFTSDKEGQVQVVRNLALEAQRASTLLSEMQLLEGVDVGADLMVLERPEDCLSLLDMLQHHADLCVVEWPEGVRYRLKATVGFENLKLRIKSKTNWFELEGEIRVDEQTVLSLVELLAMSERGHGRFVELRQGEFLMLSEQLRKRLEELKGLGAVHKDKVHLHKLASVAWSEAVNELGDVTVDKGWKDFQARVAQSTALPVNLPAGLHAELRSYQEEGFVWMARLASWEAGACLADDMGLGKTVQALALLLHRASEGPALVVCPVSVVPNWMAEAERFAPSLTMKRLVNGGRDQLLEGLGPRDVLVVSYGLMQSESAALSQRVFSTVLLDEAHTIKNTSTKTSKAAMKLQGSFRLALTGTPIQNHLGEIWNLFEFLNPGLLGSLDGFTDRFVRDERPAARKQLRKLLAPFLLRRVKSAVLDELPPKTEILKRIELSEPERAFYEALRREAVRLLEEGGDEPAGARHLKALAEIMRLRQAACHPALVNPVVSIPSSKLSAFMDIVSELKEGQHRPLVFSQFVSHLALVRAALDKAGYSYHYLDGSTPMAERSRLVKAFQNGEADMFLISLKAGGLGLNLTAADYVIHLDPWWNPAVEDQASDRAHRIGQSKPVTIYRLVAENTIEEKILRLHATKRDLAETLLHGTDTTAKLTLDQLKELLTS